MALFSLFPGWSQRDRFARMVIAKARAKGWRHSLTYDREHFELQCGEPDKSRLFLENTFAFWRNASGVEGHVAVDKLVASLFEGSAIGSLEDILPTLLPVVRNRRDVETGWLDERMSIARDESVGAYQPLCEALAIGVAIDRPASLVRVGAKYLKEWNTTLEPLLERAISNLRERNSDSFKRTDAGFFVSEFDDQYDCSRLLTPEIFHRLPLFGDPVAIAVAREGLVVAGSRDVKSLLAMADFAEKAFENSVRAISYQPLILNERTWSVFAPEDPALTPLLDLKVKQALWDCECQREVLQGYCERVGRDVYVARLEARRFDGAAARTWTTWSQGVATLLPRADAMAIYRPEDERWFMRSWDDVRLVCGDRMVDEALYPARYFAQSLSKEQFSRLEHDFSLPSWMPAPANPGVIS